MGSLVQMELWETRRMSLEAAKVLVARERTFLGPLEECRMVRFGRGF